MAFAAGQVVAAVAEVAVVAGTTESAAAELGMRAQSAAGPEKRETEVTEAPEVVVAVVAAG